MQVNVNKLKFFVISVFLGGSALLLLANCAKERRVEFFPDPENLIFDKSNFVGPIASAQSDNQVKHWFHKVTVTDVSRNNSLRPLTWVGRQSVMKIGFFDVTDTELRFYNSLSQNNSLSEDFHGGIGPKKNADPVILNDLLHSWNVEHIDVRLRTSDGKTTNREENNPYVPRGEKRYFKIDWNSLTLNEEQLFNHSEYFSVCWSRVRSNVESDSIEQLEDYISFTISVDYKYNFSSDRCRYFSVNPGYVFTVYYKHSFKLFKEDEDLNFNKYKPFVYQTKTHEAIYDPVNRKYGYFPTSLLITNKDNLIENRIMMQRWNPNKRHTFYFTPNFPEEHKWIFNDPEKGIFHKINKVFASRNLPTRFEIRENTGQKLGDLRYSFVHIITSHQAPLLGYGPSDANPLTGEIIAANTILWTRPFDFIIKVLEDQLPRMKREVLNDREKNFLVDIVQGLKLEQQPKPYDQLEEFVKASSSILKTDSLVSDAFYKSLPDLTYTPPGPWGLVGAHPASQSGSSMVDGVVELTGERAPEFDLFNFRSATGLLGSVEEIVGLDRRLKEQPMHFSDDRVGFSSHSLGNSLGNRLPKLRGQLPDEIYNFDKLEEIQGDLNYVLKDGYFNENALWNSDSFSTPQVRDLNDHRIYVSYPNLSDTLASGGYVGSLQTAGNIDQSKIDKVLEDIRNGNVNEISNRMLRGVAIHEIGHNLGLRHNFYGSADERNFHSEDTHTHGGGIRYSSSVMEYDDIFSMVFSENEGNFGTYDKAALLYGYSGGGRDDEERIDLAKEQNINYLYCSDYETHNVLCNLRDRGLTFTEVVFNSIINYVNSFYITHLPFHRVNFFGKDRLLKRRALATMWRMKNFLVSVSGFLTKQLRKSLQEQGGQHSNEEVERIIKVVRSDLIQANLLAASFLNAVIKIPKSQRDFNTRIGVSSGVPEQYGIHWDKIYALVALLGDDSWLYHPNEYNYRLSYHQVYVTLGNEDYLPYTRVIEDIVEERVAQRVDEDPWFVGWGRLFYALDATNVVNREDRYIEQIGVTCYSSIESLKRYLIVDKDFDPLNIRGFTGNLDDNLNSRKITFDILDLSQYELAENVFETDFWLSPRSAGTDVASKHLVGIVQSSSGEYYVASELNNPISYNIISANIHNPTFLKKRAVDDVIQLYKLYHAVQDGMGDVSSCK